jgi:glycosyltransferase involved in cell wall biosynthesis
MTSLSVITITYKDPDGLRSTMESISESSDKINEWIVVDSSAEQNREVLASIPHGLRIKHIKIPASGIYAAMNAGLAVAEFEAIWFLNSGDRLCNRNALVKCLDAFSDSSVDAVCANARLFKRGEFQYLVKAPNSFWAGIKNGNGICHQAVIYRFNSFKELFPYSTRFKLAADFDLHIRAWNKGLRLRPLASELVDYDMSGVSSSTKEVLAEFAEVVKLHAQGISGVRLRLGVFFERARICILKAVAASPLAGLLRPLWIIYKRAGL